MSEAIWSMGVAGLLALLPACLHAQDRLLPPGDGCTTYLTVQTRECRVEHHFTCENSGTDRWRIVYLQSGPSFLSRIDDEAQWLLSYRLPDRVATATVFPATDPASVTVLLEQGVDTFDFTQRRPDGTIERVYGEDRIVERNVMIDGEVLHRTQFDVTYARPDGSVIVRYTGSEYVSDVYRRFFAGRGKSVADGVDTSFDRSPMEFVHPGEPGFASVEPMYDCGMMMSALEVSE